MAAGAIIVVSRVAKSSPAWPRLMPEQSRVTLDTEQELRFTTVKAAWKWDSRLPALC